MKPGEPERTQSLFVPPAPSAPMEIRIRVASCTDVGLVRSGNEDALVVRFFDDASGGAVGAGEGGTAGRGALLAVSDGMGGVEAGEIASGITVETFGRVVEDEWGRRGERTEFAELRNDLRTAVARANRAVLDDAAENPSRHGMGATLTAAVVYRDHLLVAHVGDSRCYLLRAGVLKCLTADQTLAEELVRRGIVNRGSPAYDVRRSVLIRVVGQSGRLEPDTETAALADGDRILLCSDGLHGPVEDSEIESILDGSPSPEAAARDLVEAARRNGAPDNVTCVVGFVEGSGLPTPASLDVGGATVSVALEAVVAADATQSMEARKADATGEFDADEMFDGAGAPVDVPPLDAQVAGTLPPRGAYSASQPVPGHIEDISVEAEAASHGSDAVAIHPQVLGARILPSLAPTPPLPAVPAGQEVWIGLWILLAVLLLGKMMVP